MPTRKFIKIDEEKCNGCGECIISCADGVLAIVNGKAKVIGENLCDGLGACIGHCPMDALTIIDRDVAEFDEHAVEEHLRQIASGQQTPCCPSMSFGTKMGCPSAMPSTRESRDAHGLPASSSALSHWPIQLGLVNPNAEYFNNKRLLLAADCSAFAYSAFHRDFLSGAAIVIACPKLDNATTIYVSKLASIITTAGTTMIEVLRMEVPCCGGLNHIAHEAVKMAGAFCHVKETIIGIQGELLKSS